MSDVPAFMREAAATGLIDPRPLIENAAEDGDRLSALDALARESEEVNHGGRMVWRLLPEARRRLLGSGDAAQWREIAAGVEPLPGDGFGSALRSLLQGAVPDIAAAPPEALDELHEALLFAKPVLGDPAPALLRALRGRIARKEADNAQSVARSGGALFGRAGDLAVLEQFVATGSLPARYAFGAVAPRWMMLLTGVGGLGKSAVIAGLTAALRGTDWRGRAVVLLDFDRAALRSVDVLELTREFSRQLAIARPEQLETPMATLRHTIGTIASTSGACDRSSQLGALSVVLPQLGQLLDAAGVEPPVVVLDTFEEIGVLVPEAQDAVLDWIMALRNHAGLERMPVIVSARVPPELGRPLETVFGGHVAMDGLDPESGAALLRSRDATAGFEGERGAQAASALGGHPLALIMLARYAETASAADIDAVTNGGGAAGKFDAAFAQSFLYARILGRMVSGDKRVAKVASPGLALRRVTPALIEHVLAEPCGLELGDDPPLAAKALFNQLVRHYWLVERDPSAPDVVRHRRDLRRLMLPQIMASEAPDEHGRPMRERALAAHRAARAWYAAGRDETLAPSLQAVEAFYHRCFLPDAVLGDADHALASQLGEDAHDLPLAARALVKFTAGQVLDAGEIDALPQRLRLVARSKLEAMASRVGATEQVIEQTHLRRSEEAVMTPSPRQPARGASLAAVERELGREVLARFSRGDFGSVSEIAAEHYWPTMRELPRVFDWSGADTLFSGFWAAAMCSLLSSPAVWDDGGIGDELEFWANTEPSTMQHKLYTVAMLFALSSEERRRESAIRLLRRVPMISSGAVGPLQLRIQSILLIDAAPSRFRASRHSMGFEARQAALLGGLFEAKTPHQFAVEIVSFDDVGRERLRRALDRERQLSFKGEQVERTVELDFYRPEDRRRFAPTILPELYPPVLTLLRRGPPLPRRIVRQLWHRDPRFVEDVPEPRRPESDEVGTRLLIETIDRHRLLEPCLREAYRESGDVAFLNTADVIHAYEARLGWPPARAIEAEPVF